MDTRPTAYDAAYQQNLMGYDGRNNTDHSAVQAIYYFPDDSLVSFHTHGDNYRLLFWNGTNLSLIQTSVFGDRVPGVYYLSDFNNGELEDVLFILYAMCHSAEINATYGNFLTMSQNKGVDNAIGFRDDISNSKAIYWNNRFWYHTNNNYNLYSAAYVATYETALYPPITGNYSGLESWVLAGNWQTKLEPARYGN